jgi:DNA invertase Pin-like site-specific DNA recombinase
MFQMLGVFAEFERSMIWERVRAGLARAKGEGKRLGRPPIPAKLGNAIREPLNKPGRPGAEEPDHQHRRLLRARRKRPRRGCAAEHGY